MNWKSKQWTTFSTENKHWQEGILSESVQGWATKYSTIKPLNRTSEVTDREQGLNLVFISRSQWCRKCQTRNAKCMCILVITETNSTGQGNYANIKNSCFQINSDTLIAIPGCKRFESRQSLCLFIFYLQQRLVLFSLFITSTTSSNHNVRVCYLINSNCLIYSSCLIKLRLQVLMPCM